MDPLTAIAYSLAQFAPDVVRWITGSDRAAEAAGKVVEVAKVVTGKASPDDAVAAISADPAAALAFRKAIADISADMDKEYLKDRQDARDMQKVTRSLVPAVLSLLVTVGYFGVLIGMMSGSLKVSDSQALLIMLGSLTTAWGMVMAFWFGTTYDSGRKSEWMASKA